MKQDNHNYKKKAIIYHLPNGNCRQCVKVKNIFPKVKALKATILKTKTANLSSNLSTEANC